MANAKTAINKLIDGILLAVENKLKSAKYDKSVHGKIISSLPHNKYRVLIDGQIYTAKATSIYNVDEIVNVIIPQNNYSQMYIIPKGVTPDMTIPASGGNSDTVNHHTVESDVPINAVFTDTVYTHPEIHSADMIVDGTTNKVYTTIEKAKLAEIEDKANNYIHPVIHPPSIIKQDVSNRFVTDIEKTIWNEKQNALGFTPENTTNKGIANGYAELDSAGKVPSTQLPSYVDDVLEYASLSAFPTIGETCKIYVSQDTNVTYRWSGTAYVEISKSLALGETSSTAYRGDRGKIAYNHSQTEHNYEPANVNIQSHISNIANPHGVTKAQVGLGSVNNTADSNKHVLSASKLTTARTINGVSFDGTNNIIIEDSTKEPIITKNTAFNKNYGTTVTDIRMNGTQATGVIDAVARIDHVHPTDTSKVSTSTTVNGHVLTGNVTVTASDVGLGNVTNESKSTMFTSPAFTGTPTAPTAIKGTNTTQVATTAFVQQEMSDAGLGDMLKSVYDADNDGVVDKSDIATKLDVPRNINGVAFDGSADIIITANPDYHTHSKNEITDFPQSLPADGGNSSTVNGHTVNADVPSGAKFTDTVYTHPSTHPASMITGLPTSLPANGGNADTAKGLIGDDTRSINSAPSEYMSGGSRYINRAGWQTEFKYISTIGAGSFLTGTYCYLETKTPWSDPSGGYPIQIAYGAGRPCWRVGTSNTTWNSWSGFADGGNADTVGGFTVGINVPANAKFTDTVYTHPTTAGNKHIPTGGASGQFLKWSASGTAVWAADNNTTYSVATSTTNGLLSSADKTKLDSVASNSNNSLISTTQPTTQSIGDIWFVEVLR